MKSTIQDKTKIVNSVFSDVFEKYDLMNDIMSLGIHRIWKEKFIDWMSPLSNKKLIDVASGTGDVVKLFLTKTNGLNEITCVEPNIKMLEKGKQKLKKYNSITWINSMAEKIPVKSNSFDYYTISYGIRNVSDINSTLKEAYRVLKPGGQIITLTPEWQYIYKSFYEDFTHRTPFTNVSLRDIHEMSGFKDIQVESFKQLPIIFEEKHFSEIFSFFSFLTRILVPEKFRMKTKWIRFSKEIMLLSTAKKK